MKEGITTCLRKQFRSDLSQFLVTTIEKGDQITAMGNWNTKMKQVDNLFGALDMKEAIRKLHPGKDQPVTYQ